jgi:hypothetical protein
MKVLSPSLFVAIFGYLRPYPWVSLEELEEDAYSLFYSRSQLMGWSRSTTRTDGRGLWDMNDASFDPSGNGAGRIAWFQVGVDEQALTGSSFPFHPLLACAGDSLGRVGELELEAVQLLVPLQAAGASAPLSSVPNWFNVCNPSSRVGMRVTLDSGEDPVMPQIANELTELVSKMARDPFDVEPSSTETEHVELQPEVTDGFWLGEGRHPVTFETVAPDWTLDSIAWTANLFAESCRRIGVETSVLINVGKR